MANDKSGKSDKGNKGNGAKPSNGDGAKTAATDATATTPPTGEKPKKPKKERIRLTSKNFPQLWVRAFKSVHDAAVAANNGNPVLYDAKGEALIVKAGVPGGTRVPGEAGGKKAARKAAKDAEAALLAGMTDEQKLEHARKIRVERQAAKAAKEEAARQAIIDQVMADIAGGKIALPAKNA